MKRGGGANEALVGLVVIAAVVVAAVGSMWLSGRTGAGATRYQNARFRTIGGLKGGDPVLLQGVQVGRVDRVEIDTIEHGWVNVVLQISRKAKAPENPVAIIASRTLFGDWAVTLMSQREVPTDPEVLRQVREARALGHAKWPGATLPDIGQITAQASRIAGDIAKLSSRVDSTFDSTSVRRLQNSLRDFSLLSRSLARIAASQESSLVKIGANLDTGTAALAVTARHAAVAAARADSATNREQLQRILSNADTAARDIRGLASDIHGLSSAAVSQQAALTRLIANSDSIIARIQAGQGTLGLLTRDSALYRSSVEAVQQFRDLLADMKQSPRKYFSFSVF